MQKIKEVLSGGDHNISDKTHSPTGQTHNTSLGSNTETSSLGQTGSSGIPSRTGDQLPATGARVGRAEETMGSHAVASGAGTGNFTDPHSIGHDRSTAKFDPTAENTSHDHKHLAAVTHKNVQHHEVEEVERQKEHERHIHHVQHHVQPILDKQDTEEVHHQKIHPTTKIVEKHASTEKDVADLAAVAGQHRNTETHGENVKTIIDKGERVKETQQHHVHHVTQPVIEQEVHDRHRTHTVIPTHHVSHEAPIVHASAVHEPISMDQFKQGGGKLDSGLTHQNAGVLSNDGCERTVDGPGERIAENLGLAKGTAANQHESNTRI